MSTRTQRILLAAKKIAESEQKINSTPSTSLSQQNTTTAQKEPPVVSSSIVAGEHRHYSSGSSVESDLCEDSEDSYRPSDENNEENPSIRDSSGDSDDSDNIATAPNVPTPVATWGSCGNISNYLQFSAQCGLQSNQIDIAKPYKIYRQFIDNDVLDIIAEETNRYASQYIQSSQLSRRSLARQWSNTDRDELRKFFGILMIMGINHLPKMRLYWSKSKMYTNDLIRNSMKRDRFDLLLKFLHFCNNDDIPQNSDRLHKIRNILNRIINNFQKTMKPDKEVVIDETMMPWRGRLVFRQYLPAKTHKYGIKIYKVCTPEGYTYNFSIYCGKNGNVSAHGHTFDITVELMEGLLDEGRILYIDNFYNSVKLSEYLLQKKNPHMWYLANK